MGVFSTAYTHLMRGYLSCSSNARMQWFRNASLVLSACLHLLVSLLAQRYMLLWCFLTDIVMYYSINWWAYFRELALWIYCATMTTRVDTKQKNIYKQLQHIQPKKHLSQVQLKTHSTRHIPLQALQALEVMSWYSSGNTFIFPCARDVKLEHFSSTLLRQVQ